MFRAAVFFLAAVISYLTTAWLIVAPAWLRRLDVPNDRSSHREPTPRIGGIGIVAAFVLLMPLLRIMQLSDASNWMLAAKFAIALLGFVVIAAVGLIDDFHHISPGFKWMGQLLAALIAIWGGAIFQQLHLPFVGTIALYDQGLAGWLLGAVLTVIWLTGFSNFFNFMDGIDGIAGGVGAIYSLALAVVCIWTGHRLLGAGSLILAAACLGFLAHNFPPARIFMGDVGSLFIGYVLAAFAVVTTNSGTRPVPFPAVLLIFGTFLHDAIFTIIRRWRRGEKLYEAHRSHLYQRLVIAGQSHRRVTLTYYGLSLLLGLAGIAYLPASDGERILILGASFAVLAGFTIYVYRYEMRVGRYRQMVAVEPAEG